MGCPKDERSSSQKWHQAPRVAPAGPAAEHPSLEFGDLGIWGPVRGQGPGSAERPRCFRVPVPLCWRTLPLCCSPNVLLIHTPRPAPQVRGQPRGGHSGLGSRGETRAPRWVPAPLLSRVRTQPDARRPQVPHHFGGPHPTNTSGTESGPPDSQSRGGAGNPKQRSPRCVPRDQRSANELRGEPKRSAGETCPGKNPPCAPSPLTNQEPAPFLSKTCSVFRAFFPLVSLRKECSERGRGYFPARLRN